MPLVVDKEAIRLEILEAFEALAEKKPLTDISLREVAAEAGMSHTKVLRHFGSKNGLYVAGVHWAGSFLYKGIDEWFSSHDRSDFASNQKFLDAFFRYIADGEFPSVTPRDIVMTCALGAYSDDIRRAIREEFQSLSRLLSSRLSEAFGRELSGDEASAALLMFCGIFFAGFNEAVTGCQNPVWGIQKLLDE